MFYSPTCFSALPSLYEARLAFAERNALKDIEGPICDLFLANGVHGRYGIALLHRHFAISPSERLVDYHHTATAWDAKDIIVDTFERYNGVVTPRSYLFDEDGTMRPYEFVFTPGEGGNCEQSGDTDFFKSLHALLCTRGLEKILGLRDLRGHDPKLTVEITEGMANIMLPYNALTDSEANLIEAMWIFSSGTTVRCHCREYCFRRSGGYHEENHGCS